MAASFPRGYTQYEASVGYVLHTIASFSNSAGVQDERLIGLWRRRNMTTCLIELDSELVDESKRIVVI